MTRNRVAASLGLATAMGGVTATLAIPIANADPLNGVRAAVNNARSGSPCGALNYNDTLQALAQNRIRLDDEQFPVRGIYEGEQVTVWAQGDPTARATQDLIGRAGNQIRDCKYKDYGVGMVRWGGGSDMSSVSVALGAPKPPAPAPAAEPPAPRILRPAPPARPAPASVPEPPKAPTNAVTMNITRAGLQVRVDVASTADIPGRCTYNAREVNGLGFPASRDFNLGPKGSTTLNFPRPLIGQTYNAVASCRGPFNGQDVEFGRVAQDVSGF